MDFYVVKVYTTSSMYRGVIVYDNEDEATEAYNQEKLFGRFIRAELWVGTLENNVWKDDRLLLTKP